MIDMFHQTCKRRGFQAQSAGFGATAQLRPLALPAPTVRQVPPRPQEGSQGRAIERGERLDALHGSTPLVSAAPKYRRDARERQRPSRLMSCRIARHIASLLETAPAPR